MVKIIFKGNGVITESEFSAAPWIFENQVGKKRGNKRKKSQKHLKKEKKARKKGKHHQTTTAAPGTSNIPEKSQNEKGRKKRSSTGTH